MTIVPGRVARRGRRAALASGLAPRDHGPGRYLGLGLRGRRLGQAWSPGLAAAGVAGGVGLRRRVGRSAAGRRGGRRGPPPGRGRRAGAVRRAAGSGERATSLCWCCSWPPRCEAAPRPGVAARRVCSALPGPAADRLAVIGDRAGARRRPARVWASLAADPELAPAGPGLARAERTGAPVAGVVERLADDLATPAGRGRGPGAHGRCACRAAAGALPAAGVPAAGHRSARGLPHLRDPPVVGLPVAEPPAVHRRPHVRVVHSGCGGGRAGWVVAARVVIEGSHEAPGKKGKSHDAGEHQP